jgi:hypothetical protein
MTQKLNGNTDLAAGGTRGTGRDIARFRLYNQRIIHSAFEKPEEVVRHMVAMQAQDFYASLWAVAVRINPHITEAEVEQAVSNGKIVRTWPVRGTLHYVASEDARWMLNLLTPRVIKNSAGRHRELELNQADFNNSRKRIENALQGGKQLTRSEVYDVLETNSIATDGQRGYHILWYLAQKAVICCGPRRDKQHTFVLFDDWISHSRDLKGDEALSELASRYISSRGPVTEYDFACWAGLKITTARNTFRMVEKQFETMETHGQTFLLPPPDTSQQPTMEDPILLPSFDELVCGYKDRSAVLRSEKEKSVILRNGIIRPLIICNGQVAGTWKRTIKRNEVQIETDYFHPPGSSFIKKTEQKFDEYGMFLGLPVSR